MTHFRTLVAMIAGASLFAAGQMAVGQGVASGFRQVVETPLQRLTTAIRQIGVQRCAPVFEQAGSFLFENAQAQFVVQPLGPDANRWPTAVTIESSHPPSGQRTTDQTRLTTLVVAPAGSCSGLYNQVIYWPEPCAALKKRVFAAFGNERPLLARVRQSEANPGLQLYLMPAGPNGCVSVKKELIG